MESPGAYVTGSVSNNPFFLSPVFFRSALPYSGGYHLERGGMALHDAVGVNCEESATTETRGV